MSGSPQRMPLIDALKGIASQLIVLHHLALYGPLSLAFAGDFADLSEWLVDYGRMAVQVFLVIGGFLAARGLSPQGAALAGNPLPLIGQRYLRLALPFFVAIGLAIIASAIADQWLDDPAIPARATVAQWLAHVFLVHGLLGAESLSAGVWYVAIDFQLYALLALLLWLGRNPAGARSSVLALLLASLYYFNLDSDLDNWAIYFFGSYALGVAAWWASAASLPRHHVMLWLGLLTAVACGALLEEFRLRIAIALSTALLLGYARYSNGLYRWLDSRLLAWLGRISYSLFLIHFPILLLVNAAFAHSHAEDPLAVLWWVLVSWSLCLAGGLAFHRWIEVPASRWRLPARQAGRRRQSAGAPPA